ncbi:hypothetical protein DPEC_G00177480 [Dallia pectoralis]|uniref:Uncharacterized protein n=1 Tax=Dallia pectoralis TaxID=75939 RepID=A0ACC2GF95_DALPE|nr:hypothetical protein DPEC_G00177480 [Dallia pectoralis]
MPGNTSSFLPCSLTSGLRNTLSLAFPPVFGCQKHVLLPAVLRCQETQTLFCPARCTLVSETHCPSPSPLSLGVRNTFSSQMYSCPWKHMLFFALLADLWAQKHTVLCWSHCPFLVSETHCPWPFPQSLGVRNTFSSQLYSGAWKHKLFLPCSLPIGLRNTLSLAFPPVFGCQKHVLLPAVLRNTLSLAFPPVFGCQKHVLLPAVLGAGNTSSFLPCSLPTGLRNTLSLAFPPVFGCQKHVLLPAVLRNTLSLAFPPVFGRQKHVLLPAVLGSREHKHFFALLAALWFQKQTVLCWSHCPFLVSETHCPWPFPLSLGVRNTFSSQLYSGAGKHKLIFALLAALRSQKHSSFALAAVLGSQKHTLSALSA